MALSSTYFCSQPFKESVEISETRTLFSVILVFRVNQFISYIFSIDEEIALLSQVRRESDGEEEFEMMYQKARQKYDEKVLDESENLDYVESKCEKYFALSHKR